MRILLTAAQVERRVGELAARVAADFAGRSPVVVGILDGAAPFMMDLLRCFPEALHGEVAYDFVDASSYRGAASTGQVRITRGPGVPLAGRSVLLVDGIVDTGRTLHAVGEALRTQGPAVLRTCVLLDKPSRRQVEVAVDYRGFEIDDLFVVGYGMDFEGRYRGLRHVAVYEPDPA